MPSFFFFNDTATTEIYTLSLHDALPIWNCAATEPVGGAAASIAAITERVSASGCASPGVTMNDAGTNCASRARSARSEEHTSELQSQSNLVCRLLLEKKKNTGVCELMRE